ncbi:hypothetical protein [Pedobacter agri]|uniref:hypothetical protein n=1 Tax=Pedobacter agri TaxID=454586 RepID=UPI00292E51E7|nr:hypothetical protein [Pedobacter agri]
MNERQKISHFVCSTEKYSNTILILLKIMAKNTTNKPYNLLIEGLSAAGMGLGIYLTKPTIEKRLAKSVNLADSSLSKTLSHKPENRFLKPLTFELAGLGGIAAYRFYKGLRKNKKANIVEGIFLTSVLAAAIIYRASIPKNRIVR